MVRKVKRSEAGMIQDPVTLPTATLEDAERLMREYRIGGYPWWTCTGGFWAW